MGRGENIRTAKLPLKLTKAMAHLFTQAPHHYSAVQAIRWAQVHGLRGDTSIQERVAYDNHYIDHRTIWLDLRILARTVGQVVSRSGR